MIGIIRVLREDQDEHSAGLKTLHDSLGPSGSRFDITRSDPTFDPGGLEISTNRVRCLPIFARMADEDHRRHASSAVPEAYSIWAPMARRKIARHQWRARANALLGQPRIESESPAPGLTLSP